jgi:hypothetical protein
MLLVASLVYHSLVWVLHGDGNMFIALPMAACVCVMPLVVRLRLGYVMAVVLGLGVGAAVGCLWILGSAAMMDQPPRWPDVVPFMVVGPLMAAAGAYMHRLLQTADEAGGP